MPYNFGKSQLPNKVAQLATGITANNMVITPTMNQVTDNRFYGRPGDITTVRVAKPLPVREYDLFNDRNEPIKSDRLEYSTQSAEVSANRVYSALNIPEEDFDFSIIDSWVEPAKLQAKALANSYERNARGLLEGAKYEYVKHIDISAESIKAAAELGQDAVFNALVDARAALTRMGSPLGFGAQMYALAGSAWASLLRKNQKLTIMQGTGDFQNAFESAVIANYAGITIVEDQSIKPDEMFIYVKDAFNVWSHAPAIPQGVTGSQVNEGGIALRWIVDYDAGYLTNRSVFSAYTGFQETTDLIEAVDQANNVVLSEEQYFIRGAKLILGTGVDIEPGNGNGAGPGANADSFLAKRFKGEPVTTTFGKGTFLDLTYENIQQGHVGAGTPEAVEAPADYQDVEVNEIVNGESE